MSGERYNNILGISFSPLSLGRVVRSWVSLDRVNAEFNSNMRA